MKTIIKSMILLCAVAVATPALAQQTSGNIEGRIVDAQKAAVPGVTVTAKNTQTGLTRSEVSDAEGRYLINALPVGNYDVHAEITGFTPLDRKAIVVNVGQTTDVNLELTLAGVAEAVNVTADQPLVQTTNSSVGGVVDVKRIENMPLNGRQFANLAATIPGVGLGFHSDPTKSTQYSPQINGGNGRNLNYQIDGGDNNDDTVGGLLQLFPLEAIQEFNFTTSRAKAEYGRSNGGVMAIVTKSGTNDLHGSFFELFRDKSMNARTETEKLNDVPKGDYRRNQFGGSFGGPIVKDKAHYFAAYERTQQDTTQAVSTEGLFPELDGVYKTPYRENLLTGKVTAQMSAQQYLSVRYGRNTNSQPYGANSHTAPNGWGDSANQFNSINANHNWVLGNGRLNEFIFQYADFRNHIGAASTDPYQEFPNKVFVGQSINTPQTTEQHKFQFRDDFSWHVAGMGGLGHDFKAGANFINEPHLFITFNSGKGVLQYVHLTNDVNGPLSTVTLNDGDASANIPLKQYAFYMQDDWHVTDRITANLGLRYDLIDGYQFDQSKNPNFVRFQTLGAEGALKGIKGLENFGLSPKNDTNNWQPRLGLAWDVRGDGRDVVRGGWGIYMDMAYTNSNGLFAASDATGKGFGTVVNIDDQSGIRNPDGSFYHVGEPVSNIISQNQADTSSIPLFGQWVDPRLQMPYTRQASAGWSHQIGATMVFSADFVRADGRNLNSRPRLNVRPIGEPDADRVLAFTGLTPNALGTRPAISQGKSEYATLLYDDPRVFGPTLRTDARHTGSISGVFQVKGFMVSPIFLFRSALPVSTIEGLDTNQNSERNDIPAKAYAYDGINADGTVKVKEIGDCTTWNCGRGAGRSQLNLRVSHSFRLVGNSRIEAIGEVFNLFNAKSPGFTTGTMPRLLGDGTPNPDFMRPTNYAGDFQQPEQRVGQIGFRFSF
jgi:hypothetical protein